MLIGIFRTWLSKHPLSMAGKSSLRVTVTNTYTYIPIHAHTQERLDGKTPYSLFHSGGFVHVIELSKEQTNFCIMVLLLLK